MASIPECPAEQSVICSGMESTPVIKDLTLGVITAAKQVIRRCTNCGNPGHNKRSCKTPVVEVVEVKTSTSEDQQPFKTNVGTDNPVRIIMSRYESPVKKATNILTKEMKTKMSKLLWARSSMTPIGMKHDESWKRVSIRYTDFARIYQEYGIFELNNNPGIIVIAPPSIITSTYALDKWLMERIGSDDDFSCVIGVEGTGTRMEKQKADTFVEEANKRGWMPLRKEEESKPTGNSIWKGHYFISLRGAGTDSLSIGCVPLANDAIEYAAKDYQEYIKAQLLFMMLSVRGVEKLVTKPELLPSYKEELKEYCNMHGLLDVSKFPVSPFDSEGYLRCWSEVPITADNFLDNQHSQYYVQKCHVDSVASAVLGYDPQTKMLKTVCRPYGFMWGMTKYNALQGKGSIIDARSDLNLDKIAHLRSRLAHYEAV
jgi:hypothetical protein